MDVFTPLRALRVLYSGRARRDYREAHRNKLWAMASKDSLLDCWLMGKFRMRVSTKDQSISRKVFVSGAYELAELNFISHFVKPGMIVADIGANIGVHSLVMAGAIGPTGCLHAFEPTCAFERLKANISLNGLKHRCTLNKAALGNYCGALSLTECLAGCEAFTSAGSPSEPRVATNRRLEVPVLRLDDYVAASGFKGFDFLKIDIEGGEVQALEGAKGLLQAELLPSIMIEFNDRCLESSGSSSTHLYKFLCSYGYGLWRLDRASGKIIPCLSAPKGEWNTVLALLGGRPSSLGCERLP